MIKKILFTIFVYLNCILGGYCFSEVNISDIEYSKYGQTYENESLANRLNRLETDLFGMEQSGDLDSRLYKLEKLSMNKMQSPSNAFYDTYTSGKNKSSIRNFLDNVADTFSNSGTLTGFTPSMTYSSNPNDIYNYGLSGFTSNYSNYCPYNNYYNNKYNGLNKYKKAFGNNLYNPPKVPVGKVGVKPPYPSPVRASYNPHNHFAPYGRRPQNQNIASSFATGSSVHILEE